MLIVRAKNLKIFRCQNMYHTCILPYEIIQKIIEYIPKDRNMKSPTSNCIKYLMRIYYNYDSDIYLQHKHFSNIVLRK